MCAPTFKAPQVEWGWRIQCAQAGCERYLSKFQLPEDPFYGGGPPKLPLVRWFGEAVELDGGWFFLNHPGDHGVHLAYCPEHSSDAFAWLDAMRTWKLERSSVGKQTHASLLHRLMEWGAGLLNWNIGKAVNDWTKSNPKPKKPWEGV